MLVPTTVSRSGGNVRQTEPSPVLEVATAQPGREGTPPTTLTPPATNPAVPKAPTTSHGGRLLSLDMLRGLAILLVLGRHTVAPIAGLGAVAIVPAIWTQIGWSGVDLFFVLSGFLVSGLIFAEYKRTGGVKVGRFVIRRGFKIWPPYLVYVAFVACWLAWKHRHGVGPGVWTQLWPNLFHVQNYFGTPRIHTWSLAVEEHFYLAVALVFWWVLGRRGKQTGVSKTDALRHPGAMLRHFPLFVVVAVGGLAAVRTYAYLKHGPDDLNLYATHLRFDGLLIGTLLAYLTHVRPKALQPLARHPYAAILVGLAFAAPTLWLAPEHDMWTAGIGLTGVYVGYGLLLIGWLNVEAASRVGRWAFRTRPAAWLGAIGFFSYSIYLWHIDLGQTPLHKVALWAAAHGYNPGLVYVCVTGVYVGIAILAGRIMARLLEKPSIALRDRLFPSGIKAVAAPEGRKG